MVRSDYQWIILFVFFQVSCSPSVDLPKKIEIENSRISNDQWGFEKGEKEVIQKQTQGENPNFKVKEIQGDFSRYSNWLLKSNDEHFFSHRLKKTENAKLELFKTKDGTLEFIPVGQSSFGSQPASVNPSLKLFSANRKLEEDQGRVLFKVKEDNGGENEIEFVREFQPGVEDDAFFNLSSHPGFLPGLILNNGNPSFIDPNSFERLTEETNNFVQLNRHFFFGKNGFYHSVDSRYDIFTFRLSQGAGDSFVFNKLNIYPYRIVQVIPVLNQEDQFALRAYNSNAQSVIKLSIAETNHSLFPEGQMVSIVVEDKAFLSTSPLSVQFSPGENYKSLSVSAVASNNSKNYRFLGIQKNSVFYVLYENDTYEIYRNEEKMNSIAEVLDFKNHCFFHGCFTFILSKNQLNFFYVGTNESEHYVKTIKFSEKNRTANLSFSKEVFVLRTQSDEIDPEVRFFEISLNRNWF